MVRGDYSQAECEGSEAILQLSLPGPEARVAGGRVAILQESLPGPEVRVLFSMLFSDNS